VALFSKLKGKTLFDRRVKVNILYGHWGFYFYDYFYNQGFYEMMAMEASCL
jgi:hypothetical protein